MVNEENKPQMPTAEMILNAIKQRGMFSGFQRYEYTKPGWYDINNALKIVEAIGKSRNPAFVIDDENRFTYENFIKWAHCDTSMKCLDEGVDVPRSELAIFCASTGNPRQFIQRRGRILRTHPDKQKAEIHDLVVAPRVNYSDECFKMEQSLLKNELKRVRDFAIMSENADYAYSELKNILDYYNLSLF